MARSQPGTTTPPTDTGVASSGFAFAGERDLMQITGANMEFLMNMAYLRLKPIPSALGPARKTRRAEDSSPPGLSHMVWAERMATKEEILSLIDELNDVLKHSD
jgi:hypothetical protein